MGEHCSPFFCLNITMRRHGEKSPYSGRFKIKNKHKYIGDPENVWYRSSWECMYMSWLDKTDAILEWKSEEIQIPYLSPKDGEYHRYFPDFWIKAQTKTGIKEFIIEIKPASQVEKPKTPKRQTKQYKLKLLTWMINQQKFEAATNYAIENNMEFKILTEKELGIGHKYKHEKNKSSIGKRHRKV